jgi:hypothetical protein
MPRKKCGILFVDVRVQVPKVIELAEQALRQDKCVVIGLQVGHATCHTPRHMPKRPKHICERIIL